MLVQKFGGNSVDLKSIAEKTIAETASPNYPIPQVTYVQVLFTIKGSLHQFLTPFRAAYNQRRLTIELTRQADNRLSEKANENVPNQRKHKF